MMKHWLEDWACQLWGLVLPAAGANFLGGSRVADMKHPCWSAVSTPAWHTEAKSEMGPLAAMVLDSEFHLLCQ